ncbi:hypothetical protein ACFQ48_00095 [Hymenobacter caeli]|uniref:Lipoprotein n=1 Tax=Hymenobacter caeli TaxID=2735894 RepID=A0ABX2FJC6_9BACT|nr:hypothetical protein [Hymenobacter caeli]NRT17217.1 hypothetical protein [Hymenobacter caeli]
MRKLYPLLWALLPAVAACSANQELFTREPSTTRYKREGRTVQVPTRAVLEAGKADSTDVLTVFVEQAGQADGGSFIVDYTKPTGTPVSAYKATLLTYAYKENALVVSANYSAHLRGTLTQTPRGGFSGTFHGTRLAGAPGKRSTIKGAFTDVQPVVTKRRH